MVNWPKPWQKQNSFEENATFYSQKFDLRIFLIETREYF